MCTLVLQAAKTHVGLSYSSIIFFNAFDTGYFNFFYNKFRLEALLLKFVIFSKLIFRITIFMSK